MQSMDGFDLFSLDFTSDIEDILNSIDGLVNMEDGGDPSETAPKRGAGRLEDYQKQGFSEPQLKEISLGLSAGLPVEVYAKECYNWKQMSEIRRGLLAGVDTEAYENPLFTLDQMREIRRGLMDGIDVSGYARLIVAATDMRRERYRLTAEAYAKNPSGYGRQICDEDTGIQIRISDNYMEAYVTIPKRVQRRFTPGEIEKLLRRYDINTGILKDNIQILVTDYARDREILVAQGEVPQTGRDGWYDLRFNCSLPENPRTLPDGRVDYHSVKVAESVEPGQELAKYHPAERGKRGRTISGIPVDADSGRDLPVLSGNGIHRGSRQDSYLASVKGFVSYNPHNYRLDVWNVYVVEGDVNRYNGNLIYDGTIYIKGSVGDNAHIRAKGDIIVDGYVEGARLESGHNILIRGGVNGNGKGEIVAEGKVMGTFFESAIVKAKGSVESNYFLNCRVETEDRVIAKGKQSRILGGKTVALIGIESTSIGHYGKNRTCLDVGDMYHIDEKIRECMRQREKAESEVSQLEAGRHKLRSMFGHEEVETNALFHKTCVALSQKEEELRHLEHESERLEGVRRKAARCYVKVTGAIDPDVVIRVNGKVAQFRHGTQGVYITAAHRDEKHKGDNS